MQKHKIHTAEKKIQSKKTNIKRTLKNTNRVIKNNKEKKIIMRYTNGENCSGYCLIHYWINVKVKVSLYRPGVAQRVGRTIALLLHDRGTRRR